MAGGQILELLREIESDTLRNAAQLPSKREERPQWKGLAFQLGGVRLASRLGEVEEVLKPPRVTALPRVKDWVLGLANVRGRLIPIVDMHRFLGTSATVPRVNWRVLIVEDGDLIVGLVVEQSLGIQYFLEDSMESGKPDGLAQIRPYVDGAYRQGGRVYFVVNLRALIRDERLMDVAE